MTNPIKLVQLTDLHLRADRAAQMRGHNVYDQVERVFDALLEHPLWPADILVLTGDIVDEKEDEAYQSAYEQLAKRLSGLNTNVCAIPGNHDHPSLLHSIFQNHGFQTTGAVQLNNWNFVLLDSHQPGSVGGHLSENQLQELEQLLEQSISEHLALFVHHPVIDIGCDWLNQIKLDNGDQLLKKINTQKKQKLVLWGHSHQEHDQIINTVRMLGSPAACPVQFKPDSEEFATDEMNNAGFRWCRLFEDGSVETSVVRVK